MGFLFKRLVRAVFAPIGPPPKAGSVPHRASSSLFHAPRSSRDGSAEPLSGQHLRLGHGDDFGEQNTYLDNNNLEHSLDLG